MACFAVYVGVGALVTIFTVAWSADLFASLPWSLYLQFASCPVGVCGSLL